jgi:lipooligosaccharide transport system permease protein
MSSSDPSTRLSAGPRRPLTGAERIGALLGYHGVVLRRVWRASVVSRVLTPVLFLAAMGIGVGSLVDRASGGVAGVPYLSYVVPGIVMSSVMQWAVNESTWPVYSYIKWNQMYAAMLAAPARVADVIIAHWLQIALWNAGSAAIFIGVAALFGGVGSWWALLGIPIAVLLTLAFAAPLFWYAATVDNEEGFTTVFRLVITPLMLFSGTFFPIEQLPNWLQPVAWLTPLWHATELARSAFLGDPAPERWLLHVGVLAAYVVVGWFGAKAAFTRRLEA